MEPKAGIAERIEHRLERERDEARKQRDELLKACQAFVDTFHDHPDCDESSLGMARDAIANATKGGNGG